MWREGGSSSFPSTRPTCLHAEQVPARSRLTPLFYSHFACSSLCMPQPPSSMKARSCPTASWEMEDRLTSFFHAPCFAWAAPVERDGWGSREGHLQHPYTRAALH